MKIEKMKDISLFIACMEIIPIIIGLIDEMTEIKEYTIIMAIIILFGVAISILLKKKSIAIYTLEILFFAVLIYFWHIYIIVYVTPIWLLAGIIYKIACIANKEISKSYRISIAFTILPLELIGMAVYLVAILR